MNKLYIYTTETDREKGRYKFGGVFSDRTTESRVKDQQTGNSESLEMIFSTESDFTDHYVHNKLLDFGYSKVGKGGTEWFGGFESDDEAIATIGKILLESTNTIRFDYVPRFYQEYIKLLFIDKFNQKKGLNKLVFALELAPRFGKTLWSLDLIKSLKTEGYKICLLPAYVLTALSSFEKEFYSFNGFSDDMIFIRKGDDVESIFNEWYGKKLIILPVSLHSEDYKNKYDFIKNLPKKDKVSIIDEADFGCHRKNSQEFINFLESHLDIYITGTAIERVISPLDNIEDNIIRWSYTDMLMVKNGEHPLQKFFV